jgi:hypothetical protein
MWPNFAQIEPWKKAFNTNPSGIVTIDIRSLYPSATVKKMPVNSPLLYTRCTQQDFSLLRQNKNFLTIDVQSFCEGVRKNGNFNSDKFQLINDPPHFYNEFNALNHYLLSLPKNITIVRFQSNFTAMGQLYFSEYPVDGFLAFRKENDEKLFIKIIQYQSVYRHGHLNSCCIKNDEKTTNISRLYCGSNDKNQSTAPSLY